MSYTYTDCDCCGRFGPEEEKSYISYGDEACLGMCPRCFSEYKQKYNDGEIIKEGIPGTSTIEEKP